MMATVMRDRFAWILLAAAVCAALAGCTSVPSHTDAWLSFKYETPPGPGCGTYSFPPTANAPQQASAACPGLSDFAEAQNYYNDIGAPTTLTQWESAFGFPAGGVSPARGFYANYRDLRLGRDMNCVQGGQQVACYVTNYGTAPLCANGVTDSSCNWPNLEQAVDAAITSTYLNNPIIATVAMVFNGNLNTSSSSPPNNVMFYVYDQNGNLLPYAVLDDEGEKSVPRMCMACHGGNYAPHSSTTKATVTGASFLPFDVTSFYYSNTIPTYDEGNQQELFRMLNLMVKATNGGNQPQTTNQTAINNFINGMYCPDPNNGGVLSSCSTPVENSGSTASDTYFPSGWTGASNRKVYSEVIKPYCRMCHLAQPLTFFQASDFSDPRVPAFVCTQNDMPHAEVPFGGPAATSGTGSNNPFINSNDTSVFWLDSVAQHDLQTALAALPTPPTSNCQ